MRAKPSRRYKALFIGAVLVAAMPAAQASPRAIDREFRATYPLTAPSSSTPIAGVALARFVVPGLVESARSERAYDDGGIVLSLAERGGTVRAVVKLSVAPDAAAARQALDVELHGISTLLAKASDATLGDLVWADDTGRGTTLVLGTQANVAYSVNVVDPTAAIPTAAAIAQLLRRAMINGAPAFPVAALTLPASIDRAHGGAVHIAVSAGHSYKLRADGGYIARGSDGPVVRPFAAGTVTVHATVVDSLARVTLAHATTVAQ